MNGLLHIPTIKNSMACRIVAVEGLNGVGKSSLICRYRQDHPDVPTGYAVPKCYLADRDRMTYMLFEATPAASALYYLAGNADFRRELEASGAKRFLSDRSVWSTVAAAYAKDPSLLPELLDTVDALQDRLVIPDTVIVLRGSYETCLGRIAAKASGAEFDRDSETVFWRKYELYDLLRESGYDVRDIATDGKSREEVYAEFIAQDLWNEVIAKPRRCGHAGRTTLPASPDMVGTRVPARPRWQVFSIGSNE